MKATYFLPVICGCFILLFYIFLPNLRKVSLELSTEKSNSLRESLIVGLICIAYAVSAFSNLGNTKAPETYISFGAEVSSVTLEAEDITSLGSISIFCGIGTGAYSIHTSVDGITWTQVDMYEQDYIKLLKWHKLETDYSGVQFKYIFIGASGNPNLCEFVVRDTSGNIVPLRGCSVLTDESSLEPEQSSFMDSSYFDEIYHARTALEYIRGENAYEISHPPLGKLLIGLGMLICGTTPFGWRFMGTFFGLLMLPVMYVFSKKVFKRQFTATCCTIILATDFMHFNQTRIATIDVYAVFFILLMYLFMYMFTTTDKKTYLALSGIFFGIGCASKWTCIYAGAGLAVIWAAYWFNRRRETTFKKFLYNCIFCTGFFILVPVFIYYISYIPYGVAAELKGIGMIFSKDYFDIVKNNQIFMFTYHSGITASHPYSSKWYQWILNIRPILYYLEYFDDGTRSTFGAFANPAVAWGGLIALILLIPMAIFRKDRKAAFIIAAYLAQLVPWMFVTRITFEYHYFPCIVFLILALGYFINLIQEYTPHGKVVCTLFTSLNVILFCYFYPVLAGIRMNSYLITALYGWLDSWPF